MSNENIVEKVKKTLEEGEVKYIRDSRSYQNRVYYVVVDSKGNKLLCQGFKIKANTEDYVANTEVLQASNDKKTRKWLVTKGEVVLEDVIEYSISPFYSNPYWGMNEQEIIEMKNMKNLHSLKDDDSEGEEEEEEVIQ